MTDYPASNREHPLDRPARFALAERQSSLAISEGKARRFDPAYGVFASLEDESEAALTDLGTLIARHGDVAMLETSPPEQGPGFTLASQALGVQMVATTLYPARSTPPAPLVPLGTQDHAEMLALATLTEPGPFFARTPLLGDFYGVRIEGRLVAMAGERMRPPGHCEVSGVCTHPEFRGHGFAGALMRLVAARILDRGEVPFLHAYADNHGAIALYETLGFRLRREVLMNRLTRAA